MEKNQNGIRQTLEKTEGEIYNRQSRETHRFGEN